MSLFDWCCVRAKEMWNSGYSQVYRSYSWIYPLQDTLRYTTAQGSGDQRHELADLCSGRHWKDLKLLVTSYCWWFIMYSFLLLGFGAICIPGDFFMNRRSSLSSILTLYGFWNLYFGRYCKKYNLVNYVLFKTMYFDLNSSETSAFIIFFEILSKNIFRIHVL